MVKNFTLLFFLSLLWISCTDDDQAFDIGNDKLDVKTHMGLIDTLTVSSYTVMLDSVPTSGLQDAAIVLGHYDDNDFGIIGASSFFRVSLPSKVAGIDNANYEIRNDAVFDSVRFYLLYNEYYAGDTTLPFTINMHRLSEDIRPNVFYNNDSIACMSALLGKVTFRPSPHSGDTVWIDMDHSFGEELFELMKEEDPLVKNMESFTEYLKGFMLRYDESNNAVLGFHFPSRLSKTVYPSMRVYYHYFQFSTVNRYFDFRVEPSDETTEEHIQFNRFTLMNRKVAFPLEQSSKLPAIFTSDRSYVHAGIGIVTRLEIPYLKNLYYLSDHIRILKAQLELEPARNTYTATSLPVNISLYSTDNNNRWGSSVKDRRGNIQTADLKIDMLYQEETLYTLDVTEFLVSKLAENTDIIPALLLTVSPEGLYKTTDRLILGHQSNRDNKVILKLFYMNLE